MENEKGTFTYGIKVNFDWTNLWKLLSDHTIRQPYTVVPNGDYTPAQLGFDLPLCTLITIGSCSGEFEYKRRWTWLGPRWSKVRLPYSFGPTVLGHAHDSRMCLRDGAYVYADANIPDEVIIHEYAHIIADQKKSQGHNEKWTEIARSLGIPDPRTSVRNTYVGDALVDWKEVSGKKEMSPV